MSVEMLLLIGTAGMLLLALFIVLFVLAYQRKLGRQQQAHQRAMLGAVIKAREAERKTLSMELHDELQLDLNTVQMGLNRLSEQASAPLGDELKELAGQTMKSIERIRHISRQLYPSVLRKAGLADALEALCGEVKTAGVEIEFSQMGSGRRLSELRENALYRVVQELFSNALKHAGANRFTVLLRYREAGVELLVSDNGRGFDSGGNAPLREGLGMEHIRIRMEEIGAAYGFESSPGEGVSFYARLPLDAEQHKELS